MTSIKNSVSYDRLIWGGDSLFHQKHDFPPHITDSLLSLSPISGMVKE